jgi:pimeloyl-ACP methyl ester carboxylesterase
MDATPRNRSITPGRAIALLIIAVLVMGLAYLKFGTGADAVEVPAGAKAGQLTLEPCTYETEAGARPADCGTLVVPENRANPRSRLIALPVTRIRARHKTKAEPIFRLEGGPGGTNMKFPQASRYTADRDLVLVGYRGVDGSSVLDCPEVVSALKHSTGFLGARSMRAQARGFRRCADRLRGDGVDLAGYSLGQRVDDFEAARVALGYGRINLISESAGTRTAMVYAWRHPKSINRSVMVAVNPPGHFLWDGPKSDAQLGRYAALCAKDDECSTKTPDLVASMRRTANHMPKRWMFLPIKPGNVTLTSFYGMMESTAEAAPLTSPITLDAWQSAAKGDESGFWFMSLLADIAFPESFVWGDLAAASRNDVTQAHDRFAAGGASSAILGDAGTRFIWIDGRLADAWPATPDEGEYSRMRDSQVETLMVSGDLDGTTPYEVARDEVLPHLPNGQQVVLPVFGHTTDFWHTEVKAGSKLINTYFATGEVDKSGYPARTMDFHPSVSFSALAKGFAGAMVGFPLIALLSLLGMRRRVRRRGTIGRTGSALLRSVFALVLGLGGWFAAVLLAITIRPGTPISGELLSVVSIGTPIAIGIYLAWVHRDWSPEVRSAGFRAAAVGAAAGAWAGFHAGTGMLALITTITGAAVGANLALIAYDIARERAVSPPAAEADPALPPHAAVAR